MPRLSSTGQRRLWLFTRLVLIVLALIITLLPVYWMVSTSLKTQVEVFASPPTLWPQNLTLDNYVNLFTRRHLGGYLLNSILIVGSAVLLSLAMGSLAAYSLARFGRLQQRLNFWVLAPRMIPPVALVVPLFLMLQELGLINRKLGLILVYTAFNLPFVAWMMRSFFQEIPVDLEEAAMVDGASRLRSFRDIVLPLASPGLAATAIFSLIITYNEFFFALILTSTPAAATLPVGTAALIGKTQTLYGEMAAAGVVAAVPLVIFALLVQRHLVRGLTMGAVK
ncbi:MAG: carbohydrate ABC transporter permease [Acidobacteriia bacterium]|nr:carbohydrate ABC transporter permease [Terriglobia bacterium]